MDVRKFHPQDCPIFEYKNHPAYPGRLRHRTDGLLRDLRERRIDTKSTAVDTRPVHLHLFEGMTPNGYKYFAGHYRGEDYRCLRNHPVYIGHDAGWEPDTVPIRMGDFGK